MTLQGLGVSNVVTNDHDSGRRLSREDRSQNSSSTSFATSGHSDLETTTSTPPSTSSPDSGSRRASVPSNGCSKASTLVEQTTPPKPAQDDSGKGTEAMPPEPTPQQQPQASRTLLFRFRLCLFTRRSFSDYMTLINLLGLFLIGLLTYKLTSRTDFSGKVSACLEWDPNNKNHGLYPPWCPDALDRYRTGYYRRKRALHDSLTAGKDRSLLSLRTATNATLITLHHYTPPRLQGILPARLEPEPPDTSTIALTLALFGSMAVIALAIARLVRMRSNARRYAPPHQSSCKNEDQGRILIDFDGQAYIPERHRPAEGDYLHRYADHIRNSMSSESSGSSRSSSVFSWTSITSRNTSASSLSSIGSDKFPWGDDTDDSGGGKSESVIQLPTKDNVKIFFDPETGEFIHLSPWTSRLTEDGGDGNVEKGDTQQALVQMATGLSSFAGGRSVSETIQAALEDWEQHENDKSNIPDILNSNIVEPETSDTAKDDQQGLQQRSGRVYEHD